MPATITWVVEQMDCYPDHEGMRDVVFNVHWRCNSADGSYRGTAYGTQYLTYEARSPFTPYADLTQDQIIGWVKDAMGTERVAEIEINVAGQIEAQINPPVVVQPLPWVP